MKVADSSLAVAAFASWHERHSRARLALDGGARLVEHCALETYSVLTRLPPPHRASAAIARGFIAARFSEPFLRLSPAAHRALVLQLPEQGVVGGAVYDALVAATAAAHDAVLLTCDRRAAPIYERYGVQVELV